jgi:hypothetical protein
VCRRAAPGLYRALEFTKRPSIGRQRKAAVARLHIETSRLTIAPPVTSATRPCVPHNTWNSSFIERQ